MERKPQQAKESSCVPEEGAPGTASSWGALLLILLAAAIFGFLANHLAATRSFHPDELMVLAVEKAADSGIELEPQHRYYHRLYQWWLEEHFNQRSARWPSIMVGVLGLLSLAILSWRIGGPQAAVIAAALYLIWPRAWDDALELRYYGVVFLAATIAYHAVLAMRTGFVLIPMVLIGALAWLMARWHPTGFAFQALMLAGGYGICVSRLWAAVLGWKGEQHEEGKPRWLYRWKIGEATIVVLGGIAAAILLSGSLFDAAGGASLVERARGFQASNINPLDLIRWMTNWVDDRFAHEFVALRIVRVSFVLLVLLGLWRLARLARPLLIVMVLAWIASVLLAALFANSWERMALGYKYLTFFAPLLLLALALGIQFLLSFQLHRKIVLSALAIFLILPLGLRATVSAFGDASHYEQFWSYIQNRADPATPLLYANSETTQSLRPYSVLMDRLDANVVFSFEHEHGIVASLLDRDQPAFVALHEEALDRLPERGLLRVEKTFRSNFTPDWDILVAVPRGEVRLSGGEALFIAAPTAVLVLSGGEWVLRGGSAEINGETSLEGDRLSLRAGDYLQINPLNGELSILPSLDDPIVRPAGIAQSSPINRRNRPILLEDRTIGYSAQHVVDLEYDVYTSGRRTLQILTEGPLNPLDGFLVLLDGEVVGVFVFRDAEEREGGSMLSIPLPHTEDERNRRLSLTRILDGDIIIRELRLLEDSVDRPARDVRQQMPIGAPPHWARSGERRFETDEDARIILFGFHRDTGVRLESSGESVRVVMPADLSDGIVQFPPFAVKEGTMLIPEFEMRTRNLIRKNFVLMVQFIGSGNQLLGHPMVWQNPVDRMDTEWSRRRTVVPVPEGAEMVLFVFYVNSPPFRRLRDDGTVEIRAIRFPGAVSAED